MTRFTRVVLLAACLCTGSHAAEIPWQRSAPMRIAVTDQSLVELLRAIALENGVPIAVSEQVKGRVSGSFRATPDRLFKDLSASYGLAWFYDGQVLHVSSMSEMGTRQVGLPADRFARMRSLLAEMGMDDPRFPIRWFAPENHLLVYGPPSYLARVEELAEIVEYGPARPNSPMIARVFRLQHAWAGDVSIQQGGKDLSLPGVASLLRKAMVDGAVAPAAPAAAPARGSGPMLDFAADVPTPVLPRARAPLANVFGQMASPSTGGPPAAEKPRQGKAKPAGAMNSPGRQQPPAVEADPRINAVLVRDTRDRMAMYESLIQDLDVPVRLVEIEASIIDVDSDDSQRTGVAWRLFNDGKSSAGAGIAGTTPGTGIADNIDRGSGNLAPSSSGGVDALLPSPLGFATSIVTGGASRNFAATLDLLVRKGRARVASQPRILTLDNNEALLESQQSFYVRVAGRDQANLFQVSAGLQLRVTPQIVKIDGTEQVRLLVSIEDGALSRAQVDQVPVVARKALNTQALIKVGDSLLLGGYVVEETFDDNQKVPLLGDVPVLGHLFKRTATTTRRVERMFLITPRLPRP